MIFRKKDEPKEKSRLGFSSRSFSPSIALLNEVQRGLREVPPFPHALLRINKELQSDRSDAQSLARVLEIDPVIAATVLRIANSANVGLRREIVSIAEAITYLGFSTVKALVFRVQLGVVFSSQSGKGCFDSDKLWAHATGVARVSEELAKRAGCDTNLAFMAGLLHDIGRIAINCQFPKTVQMLWSEEWSETDSVLDRERRLFGGDHTAIGAFLAEEWNLPPDLVRMIRWHHSPMDPAMTQSTQLRKVMVIVAVANMLVKSRHAYYEGMPVDEIPVAMLDLLQMAGLATDKGMAKMIDRSVMSVGAGN
jgi:putative nucleotidyltransferase with HDIG domain